MNAILNLLEKISALTGEIAVYKESGVLAIVQIEKIIIEPDLLTFTLKPQRVRSFGLEGFKAFSVSSCFEYLHFENGCFTSSIISWTLETEPVKVTFLKKLIGEGASTDQILSAFRKRSGFYDEETSLIINKLLMLKRNIKSRKISLTRDTEFRGQAWGGAGVMVISNDEETKKKYEHFQGNMVISNYAPQIGDLFRRVGRISATSPTYDYISKRIFWESLAVAANSAGEANKTENLGRMCDRVIMVAIEFLTQEACED